MTRARLYIETLAALVALLAVGWLALSAAVHILRGAAELLSEVLW